MDTKEMLEKVKEKDSYDLPLLLDILEVFIIDEDKRKRIQEIRDAYSDFIGSTS